MRKFKFGLKLRSSDITLVDDAKALINQGFFNYIELMLNPLALDVTLFSKYALPYIIHISHETYGVNIGDVTKTEFNLKMIECGLKSADELGATHVILHSGTSSEHAARKILSKVRDNRIILENMPKVGIHGGKCLGYSVESMLSLSRGTNFGLCLDFGHAIKASISLQRDYKGVISEFLRLKPKVFHVSDGDLTSERDDHLNIKEGQYDFDYLKQCIEKSDSNLVSLETPRRNSRSLEEDLKNIKILKSLWGLER